MKNSYINAISMALLCLFIGACANGEQQGLREQFRPFTVAVIPDTQNYISYSNQKAEGFALDGADLFIAQMQSIADRSVQGGGDIVFAAAVGDVWQHQTLSIDAEHRARDFKAIDNPFFAAELAPTEKTKTIEIPKAIEGYKILAEAGVPFGVAPGNHDYDAMWSAEGYPPNLSKDPKTLKMVPEDIGILHIGGLDNFRSAFGETSDFFRDKPWYVSSFRGGANSAQIFAAGGYQFLHLTLEMAADDQVLAWAGSVLKRYPGLPTMVSTHDYLDSHGQRRANAIVDLKHIDPEMHNSAEQVWSKLVSENDQVFMVLCGHHHGQSLRVDDNKFGHKVYQILADYQGRGQVAIDAGQSIEGHRFPSLGDGWYRLMEFHLGEESPYVNIKTWSSHYRQYSGELINYANWYKDELYAHLTDAEFLQTEEFRLQLDDFIERFGMPDPEKL